MRKLGFAFGFIVLSVGLVNAQDSTKVKKKPATTQEKVEKVKEAVKNLPDMLIAQPDAGPDTVSNKLKNENLVLTVPPVWQEKGLQMGNDLKISKANETPIVETFPTPDKKYCNGVTITLNTIKKTVDERKAMVVTQLKKDLAGYYKEAGRSASADETNKLVAEMISAPESFKTTEGRQGDLYYINDIGAQQSSYYILLLIPGTKPGTLTQVQFQYYRYNYDNAFPEDVMEWKVFGFPDDQKAYVDFTKNILKTLIIR